jgi:hypothetical protein
MRVANVTHRNTVSRRRIVETAALALLATVGGCKSSTSTYDDPATISLVSGGNQTVTVNPGGFADLPLPVVVHVARNGKPVQYGALSVLVTTVGSSAPSRSYGFFTGTDGSVSMPLQVEDTPGQFKIDVSLWICAGSTFCAESKILGTLRVTGTAVK